MAKVQKENEKVNHIGEILWAVFNLGAADAMRNSPAGNVPEAVALLARAMVAATIEITPGPNLMAPLLAGIDPILDYVGGDHAA